MIHKVLKEQKNNMIKGYQKAVLPTKDNTEVTLEMNWKQKLDLTDVRIRVADKTAIISLKDLFAFVLIEGDEKMKEELLPERKTKMYKYIRQHKISINKNMKRGDIVFANCEIDIPKLMVETLREEIKSNRVQI